MNTMPTTHPDTETRYTRSAKPTVRLRRATTAELVDMARERRSAVLAQMVLAPDPASWR